MVKSFICAALIGVVVFATTLAVGTYMLNSDKSLEKNLEGNLLQAGTVPVDNSGDINKETFTFLSEGGDVIVVAEDELGGMALASDGQIIELKK